VRSTHTETAPDLRGLLVDGSCGERRLAAQLQALTLAGLSPVAVRSDPLAEMIELPSCENSKPRREAVIPRQRV